MLAGYRGFFREFARTGSLASLALQVRTGVRHVVRQLLGRRPRDPVALFVSYYAGDGFRLPDPAWGELQVAAEACLVCGLCSLECARIAGRPRLDPRDAVLAAARLEEELARLAPPEPVAGECAGCAACDAVCPSAIPIHRIQSALALLSEPSLASEAARDSSVKSGRPAVARVGGSGLDPV